MPRYTRQAILKAMKSRERVIERKIKRERQTLHRMRNKSMHVRLNSGLGPRIGYFTDHLNEIGFAIALMEGRVDIDTYPHCGVDDETSNLIQAVCDSAR